jgi:hypothetical protein
MDCCPSSHLPAHTFGQNNLCMSQVIFQSPLTNSHQAVLNEWQPLRVPMMLAGTTGQHSKQWRSTHAQGTLNHKKGDSTMMPYECLTTSERVIYYFSTPPVLLLGKANYYSH